MAAIAHDTLIKYSQRVYDGMEKEAKRNGDDTLIWEGGITAFYNSLHISNAHYSQVMGFLEEIGAVVQLRRGSRGVLSQYALHFRPADDAESSAYDSSLTRPTPVDKLATRVAGIERRLDGIDLKEYIANTERRLQKLESENRRSA